MLSPETYTMIPDINTVVVLLKLIILVSFSDIIDVLSKPEKKIRWFFLKRKFKKRGEWRPGLW